MSKTTICKRARRKIKQARTTSEKLDGFLERSDSLQQLPNIKHTRKQLAKFIVEARGVWFEKVKTYLAEYVQPTVLGRGMRRGGTATFENNLKVPNQQGIIEYNGDIKFKKGLTKLPAGLFVDGNLNLVSLKNFKKLPPRLSVKGELDISVTGITELPEDMNVGILYYDNPALKEQVEKFERNGYIGSSVYQGE